MAVNCFCFKNKKLQKSLLAIPITGHLMASFQDNLNKLGSEYQIILDRVCSRQLNS